MTREEFLAQCAEASYNYLGASGNVIGTEEDAFGEIYDRLKKHFTEKFTTFLKENTGYKEVERGVSFGKRICALELFCDFDTREEMLEIFHKVMELEE